MSLPRAWASDKKRCRKAGIPRAEQKYWRKPELGLEIIEELEGVIEYDWVGGESIYGNSPDLRQSLRELGKADVFDVGEELQVCLEKPRPMVSEKSGSGRNPSREVIEEKKINLKKLVEEIAESDWQSLT